jgi:hypothetical protein
MAAPVYQGNGGIAFGASTSVAVAYPALAANDILIIQLISNDGNADHQQPSGFSAIVTQTVQSTNATASWWWKRAAGTESGTLSCTRTSATGAGFWGVMSCWRGAVTSGTPFNTAGPATGRTSSFSSSTITPSYDNSRVICLCQLEDNTALGTLAGGNYAEDFELPQGDDTDANISANSFAQTTAAQEVARAGSVGGTDSWLTVTLALWSTTSTTRHLAATVAAVTTTATAALVNTRHLAATVAASTVTANATLNASSTIHFAATVAAVTTTPTGTAVDIFDGNLETETSAFTTQFDGKTCDGSNTLTITTTSGEYYRGTQGAEITFDGTSENAYAYVNTGAGSSAEFYARFWVKLGSDLSFGGTYQRLGLFYVGEDSNYYQSMVRFGVRSQDPATTFQWYCCFHVDQTETFWYGDALNRDQWYRVEIHWKAGTGANGGIQVKIDGVTTSLDRMTDNNSANRANLNQVEVGAWADSGSANPAATKNIWWDDVALDSTGWIGTGPVDGGVTLTISDHFSATVAAATTTASAALGVARPLSATVAASTTIAAAGLAVTRHFAATSVASTVTADAALNVTGACHFAATVGAVSATADAALVVARHLTATVAAQTTTANATLTVPQTYYVRADGSATKANAIGPRTSASACMSMATHNANAATFAPGDFINICDDGGVYRWDGSGYATMQIGSSGAAGSPITYQNLGSPVIKGSLDISTASYSWTLSGTGTNCYYCRTSGGANPGLVDPGEGLVFLDDVSCVRGASIAALTDHQWYYGDADSLGYSTVYLRDNSGDPDTTGALVEAAQAGGIWVPSQTYVTINGLEARHGAETASYLGGIIVTGGSHVTVQNCEAHWNNLHGIKLGGSYCVADNCVTSYNGVHNIAGGGNPGGHISHLRISNCVSHHAREQGAGNYGYGLKYIWVDDSEMYGNETYSNDFQGINIDGVDDDPGACRNLIYDNVIHDNVYQGIYIELHSTDTKVYRNRIYDNGSIVSDDYSKAEIGIAHSCTNCEVYHNVIYNTGTSAADHKLIYSTAAAGTGNSGLKVYNNTMVAHGRSKFGLLIDGDISPENTLIKNNIVVGTWDACLSYYGSSYTGFASDYNCFRRTESSEVISRSFTGLTLAQHCSSYSQDCNSTGSDPLFYDAGGNVYYLAGNSPCRNAGVDLGATYDDALGRTSVWPGAVVTLDQDSFGTAWEIGAYVSDLIELAATVAVSTTTADATLTVVNAVHFAATVAAVTTTADAALSMARHLSATCAASTTTANAALAVARPLAATVAATTTTASAALDVAKHMLATSAAVTTTATATLVATRHLAATVAAATVTADATLTLTGQVSFAATVAAQTTTANAALAVTRHLAATCAAVTTTASAALAVARPMAATVAATTTTAGAALVVTRHLAATNDAVTTTASATLDMARHLLATTAASTTTASAGLTVTRHLAATVAAVTTTPSVALSLARHMSALAAVTTTTANATLSMARHMLATVAAQTLTADANLTLTGQVNFAATVAASTTTAAAILKVTRHLSATPTTETVTATPIFVVSRDLLAAVLADSTTAAAALAILRDLSATVAAETVTGDAVLYVLGVGWEQRILGLNPAGVDFILGVERTHIESINTVN